MTHPVVATAPRKEKEKEWYQIMVVIIGATASFLHGMSYSWTSPSIPKITDHNDDLYDISMEEASYFTVISPFGNMFTCLLFSKLLDVIGRKWTVYTIIVPHLTLWTLTALGRSVWVFYVARFISGIGDACLFTAVPVYIGEIATPKVRGTWGNCMTLFFYSGQTVINAIGSYTTIRETAYILLAMVVVFACVFPLMPESPYYLLMKNRPEDARNSLVKLRRKTSVTEELNQLQRDVERQMSERGTWKELMTIKSNRKAVFAGIFLRSSQQLAGIGAFGLYTQYIFLKAGTVLPASASSMIFMGSCAVFNLCAGFALDKFGRRLSYIHSCLWCSVVLFGISTYFFIDENHTEVDVSGVTWIPLAGMLVYVVFYSFGLGIVPTLMLGELFSNSVKGKALCVMNIAYSVLLSSVTKIFYAMESQFGLYAPFLLFSISCLCSTILAFYFVPETRGQTLEEIQQSLKGRGKKQEKGPPEPV